MTANTTPAKGFLEILCGAIWLPDSTYTPHCGPGKVVGLLAGMLFIARCFSRILQKAPFCPPIIPAAVTYALNAV